ncbi:potassium uptake TrkH family protein [Nonomuraea fuscirosea]|uniref:Potassium uptake TrkH family protein n=1 Tax=Nonomuraea fuscirosea TaxID=1291556 RepID=A0A2T0MKJ4_9ACTN|nr:potassium transporter TrkG [Nonomuraea fuscirosea]PRX58163.1 potassium uptake TrkH family protein [Nonomuraea fuscirosea]
MTRRPALAGRGRHPTVVIAAGFGAAVLVGTLLLATPQATAEGDASHWLTALFTATSAVCVTGLVVVDTGTHWSIFGEVVIALLIQVGGLGIMTLATVITVIVSGRLGLRARLSAQLETKSVVASDLGHVLRKVVLFSLTCEAVIAVVLAGRFAVGYGEPLGRAAYLGAFHAVSAFNNAGFALWPDNLMRYVTDPWICVTIALAVIVGGLGFPVVFELLRAWRRPRRWSLLTRITVGLSTVLIAGGTLAFLMTEWRNPATMGPLNDGDKVLAAFFTAVMPRSGGFNTLDIAQMNPSSWLLTDVLMFVGGGSAGTAGGIKVTTLGFLLFMVWSELRGESHVNIGHRRLPAATQRQALSISMLGVVVVTFATWLMLIITPYGFDRVLFEIISAFATNGLSTGITADTGLAGHVLLSVLMFIGRIGPLTLGSALALKQRTRRYELPEERVIVG